MDWLELTIGAHPGILEKLTTALTAGGFSDLIIEDQGAFEEFLEENRAYWDYIDEALQQKLQGLCQVKLYLTAEDREGLEKLKDLLARQEKLLNCDLPLTVAPLAQTNWEESWKDNYPPQPVGKKLLVLPYWLAEENPEGRLPVILDPGLTFGTGAHPSTQMVMEAMEEAVRPGAICLDLGSGSGILSIAALRLGASRAIGVDIDPKAEDIARENAGYNGFQDPEFTALTGNVTTDRLLMERLGQSRYDVVLVNIVADVIISLAPVLPDFLDEKSLLICSGILEDRLAEVRTALEQAGLQIVGCREKEEWRCVSAKRRSL